MIREYLGDSVYVKYDGERIVLYLDNGEGPFSEIVLEPEVFRALIEFRRVVSVQSIGEKT